MAAAAGTGRVIGMTIDGASGTSGAPTIDAVTGRTTDAATTGGMTGGGMSGETIGVTTGGAERARPQRETESVRGWDSQAPNARPNCRAGVTQHAQRAA